MESSGIQRLFYVIWTIIKLNLYFLLFSLCGGIVLGIGPSYQTLNDLLSEYGIDYQEFTLKHYWAGFKRNFVHGNRNFWIFAALLGICAYNLYLATQIKGLIWLIITFILIFVMLMLVILFGFVVQYETTYDISAFNLWKLAFFSLFLRLGTFIKILFGVASILFLTWLFKGLLVFGTFSLLAIWGGYATKDSRQLVDRKLDAHEVAS